MMMLVNNCYDNCHSSKPANDSMTTKTNVLQHMLSILLTRSLQAESA